MANIITLKAHLLQSCKDFFLVNNLNPRRWTHNPHTGEMIAHDFSFMFNADVNRPEDPDGYEAEVSVAGTQILMPAGRMVHIGNSAGHIDSIASVLPLNTINFEEMKSLCSYIAMRFGLAGFKPVRTNAQMTEQEFLEKGLPRRQYGEWRLDAPVPIYLEIAMKNFNRMAITSFTTPLAKASPRNAKPEYIIDVDLGIESEVRAELYDLEYARNLAVNGDRNQPLPLKVWFDDPDWRPANWQGKWLK